MFKKTRIAKNCIDKDKKETLNINSNYLPAVRLWAL